MGLIKAAMGAAGGVMADQWREYFYCDSLPVQVLVAKGEKRTGSKRNSNTKGEKNIISNGSIIAVNEGQCMIIVDQGKVVEFCAEPGEFLYDTSTEPSLFYGGLGKGLLESFKTFGKRVTFAGDTAKDQRVYYFNTKELLGNKFGTASPIQFRVVDTNIGLDMDIAIRCNGEYSYRISDPLRFYTNVCGNVTESYTRGSIESQMKAELMTALQPALARISAMGIRYSLLPGHTAEIRQALTEELNQIWTQLRGLSIVNISINSVKASEEDEALIKQLQRSAALSNVNVAAGHLVGAQAEAMTAAAKNTGTGAMMAFAGMNMATQAGGINAGELLTLNSQRQAAAQSAPQGASMAAGAQAGWTCSCGMSGNTGKFCSGCGAKKPEAVSGWSCACGAVNQGRFCSSCGAKKPAGARLYRCDKCGWMPENPEQPPKFCPECGDIFDDSDIKSE